MNLDMIEEIRKEASRREKNYKRKVVKYYNKRVKSRQFRVGDLVLCQVEATGHIPRKLDPIWEAPFRVTRIARPCS